MRADRRDRSSAFLVRSASSTWTRPAPRERREHGRGSPATSIAPTPAPACGERPHVLAAEPAEGPGHDRHLPDRGRTCSPSTRSRISLLFNYLVEISTGTGHRRHSAPGVEASGTASHRQTCQACLAEARSAEAGRSRTERHYTRLVHEMNENEPRSATAVFNTVNKSRLAAERT